MSSHIEYTNALLACIGAGKVSTDSVLDGLDAAAWHALMPLLQIHGIAPYVCAHLRRTARLAFLPDEVCARLTRAYECNAARNMAVFAELDRMLAACHAHDIPVIPLKGAYLARAIYGDPALRAMGDIDIQVRPEDGRRIAEILRHAGYVSDWQGDSDWKHTSVHLPPFHRPGALPIEVHLQFTSPYTNFRIDDALIWRRAHPDPGRLPGCLAMDAGDVFLILCNHLYRTRFRVGLRHLLDLQVLMAVRGAEMSGSELLLRARSWNMEKALWTTLAMMADILDVQMPGNLPSPPTGFDMDRSLIQGLRNRIFRQADLSPAMDWLYQVLRVTKKPWRPADTLPGAITGRNNVSSGPIDHIRKAGTAFCRFAATACSHPCRQWKAARHLWREENFDHWLECP